MRERRPGVWQLRVYLGVDPASGKKRYVGRSLTGGKRDAQRALARLVTEAESLAAAKPAAIEAKKMTLTELVDEHIRRHEGSPTTLIAYRSILKTHIAPTIGRLPVVDVDPAILDRFYEHLTNEKRGVCCVADRVVRGMVSWPSSQIARASSSNAAATRSRSLSGSTPSS